MSSLPTQHETAQLPTHAVVAGGLCSQGWREAVAPVACAFQLRNRSSYLPAAPSLGNTRPTAFGIMPEVDS